MRSLYVSARKTTKVVRLRQRQVLRALQSIQLLQMLSHDLCHSCSAIPQGRLKNGFLEMMKNYLHIFGVIWTFPAWEFLRA